MTLALPALLMPAPPSGVPSAVEPRSMPLEPPIYGGAASAHALLTIATLLTRAHRLAACRPLDRMVEQVFRLPAHSSTVYREHIARTLARDDLKRFVADPTRLLGRRAIVLKAYTPGERGVLLLDYSFTFPLFAGLFDLDGIAQRYRFVLEPSWAGFCDLDILCYALLRDRVFVQSTEPRDTALLRALNLNLTPVPVGGNWWVDSRTFRPVDGIARDADLIMVAAWARYKRHGEVFAALRALKRRGEILRVILAGYPADLTLDDVFREAREYGVQSQIEIYERLSGADLNVQYNRARVNLLWSRREGFNRAIIEGMCAGVPGILRQGHNFGHRYPYINPATGCYASPATLPQTLLTMARESNDFRPRAWVQEHMSCQRATAVLSQQIKGAALELGEPWTSDLVVKTTQLDGMAYWDEANAERFAADYNFLTSLLRDRPVLPAELSRAAR
jgi:glycosyltransferase involved in cell wall biosynthesis